MFPSTGEQSAAHGARNGLGGIDPRLLNAVPHGVCIIDGTERIVFANQTLLSQIGCDRDRLTGRPLVELVATDWHDEFAAWLTSARGHAGETTFPGVPVVRCHGETFFADISLGRALEGIESLRVVSIADITARHTAEQGERQRQRLFAAHFERTPLAVIEWRPDRSVRSWNPSAERIFGFTFEEVECRDVFPLIVDPSSRSVVDRIWEQLISNTGGRSSINTNITKDGRLIQCRWHNTTLLDDAGRVIGVASLAEDITEHVRAQREISQARARLERVIHKIPVIVWAFDENLVPVLWNDHAERVTGFSADRIIGNPAVLELIYPDPKVRAECVRNWAELDFGDYDDVERSVTCADGSVRRIMWSNIAARCPVPGWRAWGVGVDVTDRHEAFEALRESERRFRNIIQNVDLAGVIIDNNGRVLFANDFFLALIGADEDEIVGNPWRSAFQAGPERNGTHPDPGPVFDFSGFRPRVEGRIQTRAGGVRTIMWTQSLLHDTAGEVIGACALGMDVTDHRRIETELASHRQHLERLVEQKTHALSDSLRRLEDSERLASLGRLAAGLGHDLGNMLLPVRCHLDTLRDADLAPDERDALAAVRTGIEFLDHLGEGLALLSGDHSIQAVSSKSQRFSLFDWWHEVLPLLREVVPQGIRLHSRFEAPLPDVRVPKHLLTRAAMNLLINAVEAITKAGYTDAWIEIHCQRGDVPDTVRLECHDSGPGMTPDVMRRALEPFYTTKTRGLSTGMGLSIVDGFARLVGGRFELSSPPGAGVVATLELPAERAEMSDFASAPVVAVEINDPRISTLCVQLLEAMGCMIIDGKQGTEADFTVSAWEECTAQTSGQSSPPWRSGRRVLIDPAEGLIGIRRALSDALHNLERYHDGTTRSRREQDDPPVLRG